MARGLIANEKGLSDLKWAFLIGAVAVAAVMYFPQLSFVIAALRYFWSWLAAGAFWPKVT